MEQFFQTVLQISLSTAAVIGILLLLVPMLQTRYNARWRKVIWFVIAVRLLIPFSFALPSAPVQMNMELDAKPLLWQSIGQNNLSVGDGITNKGLVVEPAINEAQIINQNIVALDSDTLSSVAKGQALSRGMLWFIVWLLGVSLFLFWHGSQYLRFQWNVVRVARVLPKCGAMLQRMSQDLKLSRLPKVLISSKVQGPMLVGLFRPVILLPNRIYGEQELNLILRHELIHYQQKDLWYKLALLLSNAVHWFNPLVYLMMRQAGRDLEQVCDEQVVKGQDLNYRKAYSMTILKAMSNSRGIVLSTYLSKQAQNSKKRFTAILRPKQYKKGLIALIVVIGLAVTVSGCLQIGHVNMYEKLVQQVETCIPEAINLEDADYIEHPIYYGADITGHVWEITSYDNSITTDFFVSASTESNGNLIELIVLIKNEIEQKTLERKNLSSDKAKILAAQCLETLSGEKNLYLEPWNEDIVNPMQVPRGSLGWVASSHKTGYYYEIMFDLNYGYVTYYAKYYDVPQLRQQVVDWLQKEAAHIYNPYPHIIGSETALFRAYRKGNQYIVNLGQVLFYDQENDNSIWETGKRSIPWRTMPSGEDKEELFYEVQIITEVERDGTLNFEQCSFSTKDCDIDGQTIWTPIQDLSVFVGKTQNAMGGLTKDKLKVEWAALDFVLAYLNKDRASMGIYVDEKQLPFPDYGYQPYRYQQLNFDLAKSLSKQYGQFRNNFDAQTQISLEVELPTEEGSMDYLTVTLEKIDEVWQVTDAILEK